MRKLFRSRKALSPVVASIILIAVTVAVSIAVAAWMGALTFTFMKTEELKITGHEFTAGNKIKLYFTNTGTAKLTLDFAEVNNVRQSTVTWVPTDKVLDPGEPGSAEITYSAGNFTAGVKYEFAIGTLTGGRYTYMAVAPS